MKRLAYLLIGALFFCASCTDNDKEEYKTYAVAIQLVYPDGSELSAVEGVPVKLKSSTGTIFDATTSASGKAEFTVPAGIYEASASEQRAIEGYAYILNGIKSGITVTDTWVDGTSVELSLTESKTGQIVIKELYIGGCQSNYQYDKYVILYNNSGQPATLENLCFGIALPLNAHATNYNYVDGELSYKTEGFNPAGYAIWHFQNTLTLQPGEQVVVAIYGAIDHTTTYDYSVNLANASYYAMYDTEDFSSTTYYPTPSELIPSSHYLLAEKYGQGTAWAIGNFGPGLFLFSTKNTTPAAFAGESSTNPWYNAGNPTLANLCLKVPNEWILDAVEVFSAPNLANSKKRLTDAIDAGYTVFTKDLGHTSYRNVDKTATEAIEANAGKIVYGYSDDPSGIDAEASLKAGARIVYKDTNNSTNDFHERSQSSLRD